MTIDQEILKHSIRMGKEHAVNLIASYRKACPEFNAVMTAQEAGRGLARRGATLIDRRTGEIFVITAIEGPQATYRGKTGAGIVLLSELREIFELAR